MSQNVALKESPIKIRTSDLSVYYGSKQALLGIDTAIPARSVTALIGPSGCGKSTYLRCLNRMNDAVPDCRVVGSVLLDGRELYDPAVDAPSVRARVGMVFQKPAPFPKSIYDNVAYGPRLHGTVRGRDETDALVQKCLEDAGLWGEVRDRLKTPGTALSGGQQQRLCIARALAVRPEVLLMDEPCSALDPIAAATVEELIMRLSYDYTIVIVTHSMQQARRVSQNTAFFYMGTLEEFGETQALFTQPRSDRTRDYVSGRYG